MKTIFKKFLSVFTKKNTNVNVEFKSEDLYETNYENEVNIKYEFGKLIEKIDIKKWTLHIEKLLRELNEKYNWKETDDIKKYYKILQILNNQNINDYTKKEMYFFWYILSSSFTFSNRVNEENRIIELIWI